MLSELQRGPAGAVAVAAVGGIAEAALEDVLAQEGESGRFDPLQLFHRGLGLLRREGCKRLAGLDRSGGSIESSEETMVFWDLVLVVGLQSLRHVVESAEHA